MQGIQIPDMSLSQINGICASTVSNTNTFTLTENDERYCSWCEM